MHISAGDGGGGGVAKRRRNLYTGIRWDVRENATTQPPLGEVDYVSMARHYGAIYQLILDAAWCLEIAHIPGWK